MKNKSFIARKRSNYRNKYPTTLRRSLNIKKDKYHIIAYMASHESYADSVLNYLEPDKKYFDIIVFFAM